MTTAEVIAGLPDDVELTTGVGSVKIRDLRAEMSKADGKVYLTTAEASERFGFSDYYWMEFARECGDAVKGRRWLIPASACELHMEERANRSTNGRARKSRGGRPRSSHRTH